MPEPAGDPREGGAAAWVKVRAQNERGEWFEVEGEELLARAILHEIDHLNGVLFIDRISRLKRELALRKIARCRGTGSGRHFVPFSTASRGFAW